jgi:tectonic-1/3
MLPCSLQAGLTATDSVTNKKAILRYVDGLPLPLAAAGGSCSASQRQAITYGANASSSCSVALDRAALQAYCTGSNTSAYVQNVLGALYRELAAGQVYLGAWGNSNASLVEDWVQVVTSGLPAANPVWDAQQGICSGVMTGYDLQVLTGLAGSASNPQAKVVYASLCFKFGNWRFASPAAAATPQKFFLGFDVHFLARQQAPKGGMKPVPPLFQPLPADILYPFVSSAEGRASQPGMLLLMALCALVLLV